MGLVMLFLYMVVVVAGIGLLLSVPVLLIRKGKNVAKTLVITCTTAGVGLGLFLAYYGLYGPRHGDGFGNLAGAVIGMFIAACSFVVGLVIFAVISARNPLPTPPPLPTPTTHYGPWPAYPGTVGPSESSGGQTDNS